MVMSSCGNEVGQVVAKPLVNLNKGFLISVVILTWSKQSTCLPNGETNDIYFYLSLSKTSLGEITSYSWGNKTELIESLKSIIFFRIVSGSWDNGIRLWDRKTGNCVAQKDDLHNGPISKVSSMMPLLLYTRRLIMEDSSHLILSWLLCKNAN